MRFFHSWRAAQYDPENKITYPDFPAKVPGNIQQDYAEAFDFGDYIFADRVKQFDAIEDNWWVYSANIDFERKEDEALWFVAEGVDYIFDILLNGKTIYSYEGMFTPAKVDISEAKKGDLLQVVIHPHPKREGAPAARDQADQSCKPPFSYGWDWNPRLIVSGLWRDAYLETRGAAFLRSCEPFYTLNEARDTAQVRFVADCDAPVTYTLTDMEGRVVYSGNSPEVTLNNINLWWCNGQGEPYLYSWTATAGENTLSGKIGFKTLRLVLNAGAYDEPFGFPKSRYPAPITIELNGRKIFGKGSNWVNADIFPGTVTKERYRELLEMAKDANMNILRIWGGSGINKPEFYDICDELGLLVWQEFMLACNNYVGTPHYLSVLEREAVSVIRQLRSHASLAFWCGGNELFNGWSGMTEQSEALRLLNKLCYEEDFGRPFLYTSPLCGMAHGGYFFMDPVDGRDVFEIFAAASNSAYTEFGVPSMAPVEQLRKIIPEGELFPPTPTAAWLEHHGFNAWGPHSWVCYPTIRKYFGEPKNLEEMVGYTDWMQTVGYKAAFEEARRQWPHCSMSINWCYCEPWITAANNAVISYPNIKKPGYYGIKEALRPVMASARIPHFSWKSGELFSAQLWLLNDSPEAVSDTLTAYIEINGEVIKDITWETGEVAPNTNKMGPTVNITLPRLSDCDEFTFRVKTRNGAGDSSYRLKFIPDPAAPKVRILNM